MRAHASIRTTAILLLSALLLCFSSAERTTSHAIIVFEGSDWCANCIRLHKNVLTNDTFIDYSSAAELEILRLDFPRKKLPDSIASFNARMADKYAFDGTFPTILLEETSNKSIQRIYYKGESATLFVEQLKRLINQSE